MKVSQEGPVAFRKLKVDLGEDALVIETREGLVEAVVVVAMATEVSAASAASVTGRSVVAEVDGATATEKSDDLEHSLTGMIEAVEEVAVGSAMVRGAEPLIVDEEEVVVVAGLKVTVAATASGMTTRLVQLDLFSVLYDYDCGWGYAKAG